MGDSSGNLIERNTIAGNTNGVRVVATASGNTIQRNMISGNPPIQVSTTFGASVGADIQDMSPAGTNIFKGNYCLTYAGESDPPPCPNLSQRHKRDNHEGDDDDRQESSMAAFKATLPLQAVFKRTNVGRSRFTFPQARLVNAVFHVRDWPSPHAAASARPRGTRDSEPACPAAIRANVGATFEERGRDNGAGTKPCPERRIRW